MGGKQQGPCGDWAALNVVCFAFSSFVVVSTAAYKAPIFHVPDVFFMTDK